MIGIQLGFVYYIQIKGFNIPIYNIKHLDNLGITISHSRKASCYDNPTCEDFFSHLKSVSLELNIPINEGLNVLIFL